MVTGSLLPYLEDTLSILFHYPQMNADLGAIDWLLPRPEFHHYLQALMRAGFFGARLSAYGVRS